MKPKSFKSLTDGIAEEVGVHENVVADFINFYYRLVRKNLSDLNDPKVYVENLGTFSIMKSKLKRNIERQSNILENIDINTYKGYEKHVNIITKIDKMKEVLDLINEREEEYKAFKQSK